MARRVVRFRASKMQAQNGLCYYCGQQMWRENRAAFCRLHRIGRSFAKLFRCTAEHLVARCDGGKTSAENIVAACLLCNRTRHEAKPPRDPEGHRQYVRSLLARDEWPRLPLPG